MSWPQEVVRRFVNSIMRILNLNEEFPIRSAKEFVAVDFSSDTHWIDDVREPKHFVKNQTKTVLVALQDEASTKETLSNVMSSLLVQYFASGNYGFVKLLGLNDLGSGNIVDCTLQLMEKATSVLNQVSCLHERQR